MSTIRKRQFLFFQILAVCIVSAVSCNSKTDEDESEIVVTPAMVAVKNFYLKSNDSVLHNLDSVFFSIDLNTGVIFNADSLPKGTKVDRLVPSITFANTMMKAELSFLKDNRIDTVSNYLTNPDDSIDFSRPVLLNVTAEDGVNTFTYQIKVNVHTQDPDSLVWANLQTSSLPSRYENPVAQHTVTNKNAVYILVEESNGEYTLSTSEDINEGKWSISGFTAEFTPQVNSLTATEDSFYILDTEGNLYQSQDAITWATTGLQWIKIIGAYNNSVLGIKAGEQSYIHTCYPLYSGFSETPVEDGFPLFETSVLGLIETDWADLPMAILAGGIDQAGDISSAVWAFDGSVWAIINYSDLPELMSPMLVRYVVYRNTPAAFKQRRFDVWLVIGGVDGDNEMNRKVFMSYDNGVNWSLAPEMMQLPEIVPSLAEADAIVAEYSLSTDLSEAWKKENIGSRSSYSIDGFDITWECPYIYLFGGYSLPSDASLNTKIWRGVLQRLKFTPEI